MHSAEFVCKGKDLKDLKDLKKYLGPLGLLGPFLFWREAIYQKEKILSHQP